MRRSIAPLTIIIAAVCSSPASACCLTDWLFGRTASPYAVGYAPYGYSAAYAPAYPVAYSAGYAPVVSNGVVQAQRPTYYDNPSVYTGMPVTGAYQANRIPIATNLRGNAASPGAYLGASNSYPNTYASGTYASGTYASGYGSYASAYGAAQVPTTTAPGLPLSITTPRGVPTTALPATQVAPLFAPTVPRQGGLARFFGSMFGTNYRSSYYRAPVTYYRPATTVDPVSGTTVTVQQPCTSYVQQLQRTPYSSLQGPSSTYVQPTPGCSSGSDFSSTMTPAPGPYAFGTQDPSAIGQVSATAPIGQSPYAQGQFTAPVPSTTPVPSTAPATASGGYYGQGGYAPNTAPLSGAPNSGAAGQQAPGDQVPLDQPEIRNRPPSSQNDYDPRPEPTESNQTKPESYWQLQDADDSTAMIRSTTRPQYPAQPIHAPEDYVSPFRRQLESKTTPVSRDTFEAPQLPARSYESVDSSNDSNWVSTQVREASTRNQSHSRRVAPKPILRDTTWKPARR